MINDEEDLLKAIQAHVKANLNARITAINTEKDDYTIETIKADDAHYVFAGELQDIPNHAFVQFAIESEIEVIQHSRGNMISIPPMMIEVVFDNPKDRNTYWKAMRYMRALYETVMTFDSISISDSKVSKLMPVALSLTRRELVVAGVGFSCAISN